MILSLLMRGRRMSRDLKLTCFVLNMRILTRLKMKILMRCLLNSSRLVMNYLLKVTPLTMTKRFARSVELSPKLGKSR